MGEGEKNGQMYVVVDGKTVPLVEIKEIEFQPVKHRKISRKRFIKLCMAHGFSRNDARRFAFVIGYENSVKRESNWFLKMAGVAERNKLLSYANVVCEMGW